MSYGYLWYGIQLFRHGYNKCISTTVDRGCLMTRVHRRCVMSTAAGRFNQIFTKMTPKEWLNMKSSQVLPQKSGSKRKKYTRQDYVWHLSIQAEGVPEVKKGVHHPVSMNHIRTPCIDNDTKLLAQLTYWHLTSCTGGGSWSKQGILIIQLS